MSGPETAASGPASLRSDLVREADHPDDGPRPGSGLAIVVNANAKRGGRRIAAQLTRKLTGAHVRLTKRMEEIDDFLRSIDPPRCILAAGGDGTAVALVNALDRIVPRGEPLPPFGALPLGTGNAWAHTTGARKLAWCVDRLAESRGPLPVRRYGLVECEGVLSHFAGSGWDSQILEDFRAQLERAKGPSRQVAKSVWGYLSAMLFHTAPKSIMFGRPHVTIENLGDEVYTMTADKKLLRMQGVKHGAVLYEGLASVAGAATCPEFGYRFKAYPHAERLPGFLSVRVYDENAAKAVLTIPQLWRGEHPIKGMHDWFATAVRMTFSRPVPLQIGGDACGMRRTMEYRIADRQADVLEWRRLA